MFFLKHICFLSMSYCAQSIYRNNTSPSLSPDHNLQENSNDFENKEAVIQESRENISKQCYRRFDSINYIINSMQKSKPTRIRDLKYEIQFIEKNFDEPLLDNLMEGFPLMNEQSKSCLKLIIGEIKKYFTPVLNHSLNNSENAVPVKNIEDLSLNTNCDVVDSRMIKFKKEIIKTELMLDYFDKLKIKKSIFFYYQIKYSLPDNFMTYNGKHVLVLKFAQTLNEYFNLLQITIYKRNIPKSSMPFIRVLRHYFQHYKEKILSGITDMNEEYEACQYFNTMLMQLKAILDTSEIHDIGYNLHSYTLDFNALFYRISLRIDCFINRMAVKYGHFDSHKRRHLSNNLFNFSAVFVELINNYSCFKIKYTKHIKSLVADPSVLYTDTYLKQLFNFSMLTKFLNTMLQIKDSLNGYENIKKHSTRDTNTRRKDVGNDLHLLDDINNLLLYHYFNFFSTEKNFNICILVPLLDVKFTLKYLHSIVINKLYFQNPEDILNLDNYLYNYILIRNQMKRYKYYIYNKIDAGNNIIKDLFRMISQLNYFKNKINKIYIIIDDVINMEGSNASIQIMKSLKFYIQKNLRF